MREQTLNRFKKIRLLGTMLLGVAVVLGPNVSSAKGIKCWTNNEGVRECGNSIPPQYSSKAHVRKNARGLTVERTARAKTPEELEAERQSKLAIEREKAEQERLAAIERRKDDVLVRTFATEEDMILAHRGKVAVIDSRIGHSEHTVSVIDRKLEKLRAEAAKLERRGKKVTPKLQNELNSMQLQRDNTVTAIAKRHEEKRLLNEKFEQDLARYRALKQAKRD